MRSVTLELNSNEELISLLDSRYDHIFISQFNPHESSDWWSSSIKLEGDKYLQNVSVRNMKFDLNTNLETLKNIINLNTRFLSFHQLERPIPDSLDLESLPNKAKNKILLQNGFKHSFFVQFEFLTIESFDEIFIDKLINDDSLRKIVKT